MSLQLNQLNFAGNVARDPQLRFVGKDQTPVASFSVASNRRFKDSTGELIEEVCFLEVEAWRETANFIGKYIAKGAAVLVVGRVKQESWTDKEGHKRSTYKVVAERVLFTDSKAKREEAAAPAAAEPTGAHATASPFPAPLDDEQPPF